MFPRWVMTLALALMVSCSPGGEGIAPPVASQVLPRLTELQLPNLDLVAIPGLTTRLAVAGSGHIAFLSAPRPEDSYRVQLVDSTGRTVARIGRSGDGPGELRNPVFLSFGLGERLVAWDISTGRVTAFDSTGAFEGLRGASGTLFPLALVGDSLDRRGADHTAADFRRVSLRDGGERRLLQRADTAFDGLFPIGSTGGVAMRSPPVYAAGGGRIALGEMHQGRILLYSDQGAYLGQISPLSPAEPRSLAEVSRESTAIATMPVPPARKATLLQSFRDRPRFYFRALRFDQQGRLWVVGQRGDGAAAAVYADTTLLGTVIMECPGFAGESWDLAGPFLALVCAPVDPDAPSEGILKLFRIEG